MATNTAQIKLLISQGHFESVTHFLVRSIIQRLFPRHAEQVISKIIFGIVLGFLFSLLLLIGMAGNYVFGQAQATPQILSIFLLGIVYIYIVCVLTEFQVGVITQSVKDNILDALVKESDRQSLRQSLDTAFSLRRQFWTGFIFSLLVHLAFIAVDHSLVRQFGVGFLVVNIIFHSFHGFCIYFFLAYLEWTFSDLKNYRFRLFERDPANTEVIAKLATLLQSTISLITLMVATATLIFSSTRVLPFASVAAMVFLMWTNTIGMYFINRHILKSIIVRSKWETLARIQTQIRELESKDKIPSSETLQHISQLQEHHDKILHSPDSPWDFTRFINTLNTLIWPTLGVIATNVGGFLDFIEKAKKILWP